MPELRGVPLLLAARRLLHRGRDARGRRGRERRPFLRLVRARRARAPDRPVGRALHARRRARHLLLAEAADRRARPPALGAAPARDDALGRRRATRPRVARAALAGTERRLVGGARGHPRLDALVHRGGARLGRDPARSDRSRRRPARRLAALHRHARARRARREHARLSGWRRLAQPRRRVLRRRRMGAPDRDARPRPAAREQRTRLAWIEAHAAPNGDLPEQVQDNLLRPERYQPWVEKWGTPASPLLWSHAMYLRLHHALRNRALRDRR